MRTQGCLDWKRAVSVDAHRLSRCHAVQYDAIASVEMVEAVGQEYWPDYLASISRCLKPGGRAAIQYIRIEDDMFRTLCARHGFHPALHLSRRNACCPKAGSVALAEANGLVWQDQQDFGLHYAETLRNGGACGSMRRWRKGDCPSGFDEKFVRLWRYYLMYCEGGFRGGGINVAQVTLLVK